MPQVPKAVRKERAARLRQAGDHALAGFLGRQVGRRGQVLLERDGRGRTESFAPFRFESEQHGADPGAIVEVVGRYVQEHQLVGRRAA
jgi:threonylcarbamoyladenosine tRNA methylthiotransferase MtaB